MKIILVHYKYYIQGGPERYMFKFKKLAESKGCDVIPFSIDNVNNYETQYSSYFVSSNNRDNLGTFDKSKLSIKGTLSGIFHQFHNYEAYSNLKKLIEDENPDLLYCLIPGSLATDFFKAAHEADIPIILRLSDFRLICGCNTLLRDGDVCEECIHGDYSRMLKHRCVKGSRSLSLLRMMSLSYARKHKKYSLVDAVIMPPKFTAEKIVESGYFPTEKVYVNPTFIDCSNIKPFYNHMNYVLCLGRCSPEKGFIYVVKALRFLKDIPVTVVLTGNKENCGAELIKVIEEYKLEDRINFVGFVHGEKLEKITAEAMCVACPAIWYENSPNTVIEAYSHGKPVIASSLGSLAEIVENEKTGLLFEPKNPKQIAKCIRRLYEDKNFCKELGMNAKEKCERDFNPEKHWRKFIRIYEEIK
ncbi:glycosyltransferase family 4 protein [Gottschalkiaceae bacterium SANA]|nr:glycosyltransferase family 4 protein [Gottschalkiaceae bacterium SANA]